MEALVSQLPRPQAATSERMAALICPCITVKLDGIRTLVVTSSRGRHAHTMCAVRCLSPPRGGQPFSALDAEEVGGHFYVFDALFVKGVDVRHLPLRARLREASLCLPPACIVKRYYWDPEPSLEVTVQRLVAKKLRLADGTHVHPLEGFIFTSLYSPYQHSPLKFKFHTTCDFLLSSTSCVSFTGQRRYHLHIQKKQKIERFGGHGEVQSFAALSAEEETCLGLSHKGTSLEDGAIVELKLVVTSWICIRRRRDRRSPNTLSTVLENIEIQRSGRCDARFLMKCLSCTKPAAVVREHVIDAMLRAVSVSAATVAAPAVGLFLPNAQRLQLELAAARGTERRAIGIVVPPLSFERAPTAEVHEHALTMDGVISMAARYGWGCKWMRSLRGRDFPTQHAAFSPELHATLDSMQFAILCTEGR